MLVAFAVRGVALAANIRSAKHAKRTVCFNILENLLKSFRGEFAINFLSVRIYWVYLGISEFGKAFSRIGNIRGRMVAIRLLELVQAKRIDLRRANMGKSPTASLRLFVRTTRGVQEGIGENAKQRQTPAADCMSARAETSGRRQEEAGLRLSFLVFVTLPAKVF
jgi:hypothetical protein